MKKKWEGEGNVQVYTKGVCGWWGMRAEGRKLKRSGGMLRGLHLAFFCVSWYLQWAAMDLNRPETEGEDGKETQEVEDEKFLELAS